VARIGLVALTGEHQDFDAGRDTEEVGDQGKALIGLVRLRGQAQIDQRQLRRFVQLHHQAFHLGARLGGRNLEVLAQNIGERIGYQRIVIDDQQAGLVGLGHISSRSSGTPSGHKCRSRVCSIQGARLLYACRIFDDCARDPVKVKPEPDDRVGPRRG
jgi:hypothetical protein